MFRGVAQPGRAPRLGRGCRQFESGRPDHVSSPKGAAGSLAAAGLFSAELVLRFLVEIPRAIEYRDECWAADMMFLHQVWQRVTMIAQLSIDKAHE